MSYGYDIITYGGGDTLVLLFNGIATAVGDNHYTTLIRLFSLLGLGWVLLESTFRQQFSLNVRWLVGVILLYQVLLVPKVTIHIVDRIHHDELHIVDNVPWGLALFSSLSSQVGDSITRLCEKTFSLPNDLRYFKTGTVMASSLVTEASRFRITNPDFAQNIRAYMQQCVFYDVLLGKYTLRELMNTPNLWEFMKQTASPARAFVYRNHTRQGEIVVCQKGIERLNQDWQEELNEASLLYGSRLFPEAKTSYQAKAYLLSSLNDSYGYLTQLSSEASHIMQQTMLANAIEQSLVAQGAYVNAQAAVQAYAVTRANEMKRSTYQITGELAARWIPLMKNVFEAMFYGAFLFIFLVTLLPMGANLLKTYIMSLFWLQSWAPLYAILNLIMTLDARSHSLAVTSLTNGGHGVTLSTISHLAQVNSDTAALAGYLSMSIPFIAYGIVKGGADAFTHLASNITGVGQSVATSTSAEATTGNFSLGNTHFDTHAAQNTSENHFNTNATLESGMMSYQTETGAMIHHTPGGYDVIDNRGTTISHTATGINFADSLRASAAQHYEQSLTQAQSAAQHYSHSMSEAVRNLYDLSVSQGHSTTTDDTSTLSQSSSISHNMSEMKELTERFAKEHGLATTQSAQILGDAYASLNAGTGGVGALLGIEGVVGGRINFQGASQAQGNQTWRDAEDFVKSTRYSENVEAALRNIHDHHFKEGSDEAQRLVSSISSSYDQANTYRQELSHSLQKADNYRQSANISSEQMTSLNQLASQEFVEWMHQQPAPGLHQGHMDMNTVDMILNHDPELARIYADQFIREQSTPLIEEWQHSYGSIQKNEYVVAPKHVEDGGEIKKMYNEHQLPINQHFNPSSLKDSNFASSSFKVSPTDQAISQTYDNIMGKKSALSEGGKSIEQEISAHTDSHKHDLTKRAFEKARESVGSIINSDD